MIYEFEGKTENSVWIPVRSMSKSSKTRVAVYSKKEKYVSGCIQRILPSPLPEKKPKQKAKPASNDRWNRFPWTILNAR